MKKNIGCKCCVKVVDEKLNGPNREYPEVLAVIWHKQCQEGPNDVYEHREVENLGGLEGKRERDDVLRRVALVEGQGLEVGPDVVPQFPDIAKQSQIGDIAKQGPAVGCVKGVEEEEIGNRKQEGEVDENPMRLVDV